MNKLIGCVRLYNLDANDKQIGKSELLSMDQRYSRSTMLKYAFRYAERKHFEALRLVQIKDGKEFNNSPMYYVGLPYLKVVPELTDAETVE